MTTLSVPRGAMKHNDQLGQQSAVEGSGLPRKSIMLTAELEFAQYVSCLYVCLHGLQPMPSVEQAYCTEQRYGCMITSARAELRH